MYAIARQILDEIDFVLSSVDMQEVDALVNAIVTSHTVFVYGLGREGLVMKSFAMRLAHLGVPTGVVGDMTTPPIGQGDLFLVSCGPGYLATVDALVGVAGNAGARVAMITAQPAAALPRRADQLLVLPAQTMAQREPSQGSQGSQAMGSAFEQALWILFDAVVPTLQARLHQTAEQMRARHTNLE
jgi:6-phospho-3-hexuloisomerase